MYRFFTLNYANYKKLNPDSNDYRSSVSIPIDLLTDFDSYLFHKKKSDDLFKMTANLVYNIKNSIERYPRFETLSYDLEYLGFDAIFDSTIAWTFVEEQLKLVDLNLSLSYTY